MYKGIPQALVAFVYFDNLRDKHLVHDVNPYAQPIPGAILNKPGFGPKIAKIICSGMVANTLEFANVSNLHLLISHWKCAPKTDPPWGNLSA